MASIKNIKNIAQEKAKQSPCRYKISAVGIDKLGNVVGSCTNQLRFHNKGGGLHAEIVLIKRYGSRIKSIFICRINKKGELLSIHPCKNCKEVADKLGIRIYSIKEET